MKVVPQSNAAADRASLADRLSAQQISSVFEKAMKTHVVGREKDTSVIFYDLSFLEQRIQDLLGLFPASTLHTVAVKANPLRAVLAKVATVGAGFEAATLPELHLATSVGISPDRIVFDSPTKTQEELEFALALGVHINADSLNELRRIDKLVRYRQPRGTIGVRINPQVGTGKILSTSVAGDYSKFGVPLNEQQDELRTAFTKYAWLNGVHLHIGSQGCSLEMLLNGVHRVLEFVRSIEIEFEPRNKPRVSIIDLGGGLPVSYYQNEAPTRMTEYSESLRHRFPELFDDNRKLITEFGRYVYANTGWVASRVEYVKKGSSVNTAMIHVGADLMLRECYNPQDWHHDISVVDREGRLKTGVDSVKYMIAGPLCFAGDIIAREVELPEIEAGDYVIIHDTGAYTLSMWSRYNSRQIPRVIGYRDDGSEFEVLKERETINDILRFWT